jgi:hypothetical protein
LPPATYFITVPLAEIILPESKKGATMPLEKKLRKSIIDYCTRDLPGDLNWHSDQFSFIEDHELKEKLGQV